MTTTSFSAFRAELKDPGHISDFSLKFQPGVFGEVFEKKLSLRVCLLAGGVERVGGAVVLVARFLWRGVAGIGHASNIAIRSYSAIPSPPPPAPAAWRDL